MSRKRHYRSPVPAVTEDSIGLRVFTSLMALNGIAAVSQVIESSELLALLSAVGVVVGSVVSYRRRGKKNLWIKVGITWGILLVAALFFRDLLQRIASSVSDARIPLTQMLVALQALHCFDMPKRRDLNVSALVGLALLASCSTLTRESSFLVYALLFAALGALMLFYDCRSRTRSLFADGGTVGGAPSGRRDTTVGLLARLLVWPAVMLGLVGIIFLSMPRAEFTVLRHLSLSARFDLPFIKDNSIFNRGLPGKTLRPDGSIAADPHAYFGFTEDLDLNFRGKLSDEIVMRVNSPSGQFWRAMAFDTCDGNHWTMSRPKHVSDRFAGYNSRISLEPLGFGWHGKYAREHELIQTFYIESDEPNLVPAASVPYEIYFPAQVIKVDDYSSLRCITELSRDTVYTVVSRVRKFDVPALMQLPPPPLPMPERLARQIGNCLAMPPALKAKLLPLCDRVVPASAGWFRQASMLEDYLRRHCKYDADSPATAPGSDAVSDFLFKNGRGDCEHFATTLAMLCRARGIPARLVTGFAPGIYNPLTGVWDVRMSDAHAWTEVFVPQAGWVAFDPTSSYAAGFSGIDRVSAFSYVGSFIDLALRRFFNQPQLKGAMAALAAAVMPLVGKGLRFLYLMWMPLLVAAAIATALLFALLCLWKLAAGARLWRAGGDNNNGGQPVLRCARLLQRVNHQLDSLGLGRRRHETVLEWSCRVQQEASAPLPRQKVQLLRVAAALSEFCAVYCAVRYAAQQADLQHLNRSAKGVRSAAKLPNRRQAKGGR